MEDICAFVVHRAVLLFACQLAGEAHFLRTLQTNPTIVNTVALGSNVQLIDNIMWLSIVGSEILHNPNSPANFWTTLRSHPIAFPPAPRLSVKKPCCSNSDSFA